MYTNAGTPFLLGWTLSKSFSIFYVDLYTKEVTIHKQMSNEKYPGCLESIGDYTSQLCGD